MDESNSQIIVEKTSQIVAAFVSNNETSTSELPMLIQAVHRALSGISSGAPEPEARKEPAVSVRRSVTPDYLICLEDGRKFKSLKRHLRTKYDMSPEDYRSKWGLAKDYPMVAPNYAAARSALAKNMGLGKGGRQPPKLASARVKRGKSAG
jgi:predicted transcriptional regulator